MGAGGVSARFAALAYPATTRRPSAARAAISPSMTSGSRRASRLTGAPVGPAETSLISSSTIALRSRFSRGPYIRDDPREGNPPSSSRSVRKSPASSGVSAIAMRAAPIACKGSATSRDMQTCLSLRKQRLHARCLRQGRREVGRPARIVQRRDARRESPRFRRAPGRARLRRIGFDDFDAQMRRSAQPR